MEQPKQTVKYKLENGEDDTLLFESRFESGNLRLVHKVLFDFYVLVYVVFSKMMVNMIYFYQMISTAEVTPSGSSLRYPTPGRTKKSNSTS